MTAWQQAGMHNTILTCQNVFSEKGLFLRRHEKWMIAAFCCFSPMLAHCWAALTGAYVMVICQLSTVYHPHSPEGIGLIRKISENTCMGGPGACRAFKLPWPFLSSWLDCPSPGQSHLHRYFALKFPSLQVRGSADIWNQPSSCPEGCSPTRIVPPLPHPIPTSAFPTHGVTPKQDLPTAQDVRLLTHVHALLPADSNDWCWPYV